MKLNKNIIKALYEAKCEQVSLTQDIVELFKKMVSFDTNFDCTVNTMFEDIAPSAFAKGKFPRNIKSLILGEDWEAEKILKSKSAVYDNFRKIKLSNFEFNSKDDVTIDSIDLTVNCTFHDALIIIALFNYVNGFDAAAAKKQLREVLSQINPSKEELKEIKQFANDLLPAFGKIVK